MKMLIFVAVAGFSEADLDVEVREGLLIISARKSDLEKKNYLHRGIANRSFKQQFQLADHVQVIGVNHLDGLLHTELER